MLMTEEYNSNVDRPFVPRRAFFLALLACFILSLCSCFLRRLSLAVDEAPVNSL